MRVREDLEHRVVIHTAPKRSPHDLWRISLWSKESELTKEPRLQVGIRRDLLVEAETFLCKQSLWLELLSLQRPSSSWDILPAEYERKI